MLKMCQLVQPVKVLTVCLMLSSAVLLTGCFATIFSGSTQRIQIKVIDVSDEGNLIGGATCIVSDPSGTSHFVPSNPGVVSIRRGLKSLSVNCKKVGYKQLNVMVGSSFNKTTLLNLLWLPGFAIDAVTGAYKEYPSHYVVNMEASNE